jgi:PAS domain-containing protein
VDADEIYSPMRQQSRTIALAAGLLVAGFLGAFGLVLHFQKLRSQQRQHRAGLERAAIASRYALLSRSINDVVLLMDESGRIIEANDRAVETYLYGLEELLQLEIRDLLAPSELPAFSPQWNHLSNEGSEVFEGCHRREGRLPAACRGEFAHRRNRRPQIPP